MRAVGFEKFGGPEVLKTIEAPDPRPGPGEAVVRVLATSVNRLDLLVRSGAFGAAIPLPHIPGADVVGVVEEVGPGVVDVSRGDLVVSNTIYGCGSCRYCARGDEVLCTRHKVVGVSTWGSYGELIKLPARALVRPPKGLKIEDLAAMPLAYGTAWRALRTVGRVGPGSIVFIWAAAGGFGTFAVQLAKALGAFVIAQTRSEEKGRMLKALGADAVVYGHDVAQRVAALVEDGVDVVVDTTGAYLQISINMARPGGLVVVMGYLVGPEARFDVRTLYRRGKAVVGVQTSNRWELAEALEFAARRGIRPIVQEILPVEEAAKAHALLESGKVFGKIVLRHE
ncbi:MAG: zinc-binding dehydrogenase [Thermoproteus sp.]